MVDGGLGQVASMTEKLTQAGLGRRWGLTRQRIHQMVRQGMPLTNVEEAEAWRLVRFGIAPPRPLADDGGNGSRRKQHLQNEKGAIDLPCEPAGVAEEMLGRRDLAGVRARLQEVEHETWSMLRDAIKREDYGAAVTLHRTYSRHVRDRVSIERQLVEVERAVGSLVSRDEAVGIIAEYMEPLRVLLRALPSQLAGRANPADPELARTAIQEGVDQIFRQMKRSTPS